MITFKNPIDRSRSLPVADGPAGAVFDCARLQVQTATGIYGASAVGVKDASLGRTGGQLT